MRLNVKFFTFVFMSVFNKFQALEHFGFQVFGLGMLNLYYMLINLDVPNLSVPD